MLVWFSWLAVLVIDFWSHSLQKALLKRCNLKRVFSNRASEEMLSSENWACLGKSNQRPFKPRLQQLLPAQATGLQTYPGINETFLRDNQPGIPMYFGFKGSNCFQQLVKCSSLSSREHYHPGPSLDSYDSSPFDDDFRGTRGGPQMPEASMDCPFGWPEGND